MNRFIKISRFSILKISLAFFIAFFSSLAFADTTHEVQKGETLYSIGRKYQITVPELRAANNISESDVLKAGQKLIIPSADIESAAVLSANAVTLDKNVKTDSYKVQKGDTYYGIARKYGIKVAEVFALNGLDSNAVLKVGQVIKVPVQEKIDSDVRIATSEKDLKDADPRKYSNQVVAGENVWPVKAEKVTYVKGKVSGVQLSAKSKEDVKNIRAGTVMYCGTYRGFGEVIFVQSKTGLIYAYTGLGTTKVKKGDYVVYGDSIGTVGVDAIKKESQLMLMVFRNGVPIDPAKAPRG